MKGTIDKKTYVCMSVCLYRHSYIQDHHFRILDLGSLLMSEASGFSVAFQWHRSTTGPSRGSITQHNSA